MASLGALAIARSAQGLRSMADWHKGLKPRAVQPPLEDPSPSLSPDFPPPPMKQQSSNVPSIQPHPTNPLCPASPSRLLTSELPFLDGEGVT